MHFLQASLKNKKRANAGKRMLKSHKKHPPVAKRFTLPASSEKVHAQHLLQ